MGVAMTEAQLRRKVDQLISLGVRLEAILSPLPRELRDAGNLKTELNYLIRRIERAAQEKSK